MSDIFNTAAMKKLEQDLANLGMARLDPNPDSLVNDPIFQTFQTALDEEDSDLHSLWLDTISLQIYSDPVEYLAPINNLVHFFHRQEPGVEIDYKTMREELHDFQDFIIGGQEKALALYEFINNFTGAHVEFIRASIAMHGWHMYSKMADRFYGLVSDPAFEVFVKNSIGYYEINTSAWSSYELTKHELQMKLICAQAFMENAAFRLATLKKSPEFREFKANILLAKKAKEMKETKDAERILSKYIGNQTRAERTRRKAAVANRNSKATVDRILKNSALRRRNQANIHQFGCMAREPITESVLRALNTLQEKYSDGLFDDEEKQAKEEEMEEKKVLAGIKGLTVTVKAQYEDLETMEEVMKAREPMDGILVGEGFHTVHLGA